MRESFSNLKESDFSDGSVRSGTLKNTLTTAVGIGLEGVGCEKTVMKLGVKDQDTYGLWVFPRRS